MNALIVYFIGTYYAPLLIGCCHARLLDKQPNTTTTNNCYPIPKKYYSDSKREVSVAHFSKLFPVMHSGRFHSLVFKLKAKETT